MAQRVKAMNIYFWGWNPDSYTCGTSGTTVKLFTTELYTAQPANLKPNEKTTTTTKNLCKA